VRRACVVLLTVMLCSSRAPGAVHPSASGEVFAGGGYDTNLFLEIAASPDSPNYHRYSGAFIRGTPSVSGALSGESFRLELRYGADLRQTFGSGRLYIQDADSSLLLPELGPVSVRVAVTTGRFDAGLYPSDRFWSFGAQGEVTVRLLERLRISAFYRVERRSFGDPNAILISTDLAQRADLRVVYVPRPSLELAGTTQYLLLRSTLVDPAQPVARLDRWRLGVDMSYTPLDSVTLLASGWAGVQEFGGVESDRQGGGGAAILVRVNRTFDAIARYDVFIDRATTTASHYTRQVAGIGVIGHWIAARRTNQANLAEGDQGLQIEGSRVRFRLRAPKASSVIVIGSWNEWNVEPSQQGLHRTLDPDLWERQIVIPPGHHRYHFLMDGHPVRPVNAPQYRADGFGGEDGVFEISP
jgi:hypothetical protein